MIKQTPLVPMINVIHPNERHHSGVNNLYPAPYLWNKLPHKLRSTQSTNLFKSLLKTYLFTIAFP